MSLYALGVLVDNNPGVLTRVCELFNRRGYNLESVTAGVTENPKLSRLTLISKVKSEEEIDQIIKQIKKLEDVHRVMLIDNDKCLCKKITFIKVKAEGAKRQEILNSVNIFRASVVDVTTEMLTIEITGDENKLDAFKNLLEPYGILELVSSGFIAIERG